VLIALAAAATYVWRFLGVVLADRVDAMSARFEWVGCVAYALLAGLIARMILMPFGPLAATPMGDRIGAAAIALALFYLTRRNLLVGVAAGAGALALITWGRLGLAG
jgi:branched-subunit amino acid transport protein